MGAFDIYDIRKMSITDLVRRKNYKELVPRPTPEEYEELKESIKRYGLDPMSPIVANVESMVVLDGYTRLQIAEELALEDAWVTCREFKNHLDEKLFVIRQALKRRHLNKAQMAELKVKELEVEEEKARARQRQAGQQVGKINLKNQAISQEKEEDTDGHQLDHNCGQADEKGRAAKIVATNAPISHNTLSRAKKIISTAQTDPEIAEAWDKAKQGEGSVNSVYQQVKEKEEQDRPKVVFTKVKSWKQERTEHLKRLEEEEREVQVPREELVKTFRDAARSKQMPMEAVEALMETDPHILQVWRDMRLGLVTLTVGWGVIYWKLHVWLRAQQGLEPDQEYRVKLGQEMRKSYVVLVMQLALKMTKITKLPEVFVSFLTGIDRNLFPMMYAWEDRLDLLAEKVRIRPRIRPEVAEKAQQLWKKGKKLEYYTYINLACMGDFNKKLLKEEEQERQRFGRI